MSLVSNEARFWSKVAIRTENECWLWLASTRRIGGYGQFWLNGTQVTAHRYAYELTNGPIPDGMTLDHICEQKICVNPRHLEVCTSRDNTFRSSKAPATINSKKTHCKDGHLLGEINKTGRRPCKECGRRWARESQRRKHGYKPRVTRAK